MRSCEFKHRMANIDNQGKGGLGDIGIPPDLLAPPLGRGCCYNATSTPYNRESDDRESAQSMWLGVSLKAIVILPRCCNIRSVFLRGQLCLPMRPNQVDKWEGSWRR
mmetsp:Transcript_77896/g.130808  ORF Transcript_77896/g.130808 Transcript_77896/m.130808 type:complete len:107 (-) Transcript_77896:2758-3078(-)